MSEFWKYLLELVGHYLREFVHLHANQCYGTKIDKIRTNAFVEQRNCRSSLEMQKKPRRSDRQRLSADIHIRRLERAARMQPAIRPYRGISIHVYVGFFHFFYVNEEDSKLSSELDTVSLMECMTSSCYYVESCKPSPSLLELSPPIMPPRGRQTGE